MKSLGAGESPPFTSTSLGLNWYKILGIRLSSHSILKYSVIIINREMSGLISPLNSFASFVLDRSGSWRITKDFGINRTAESDRNASGGGVGVGSVFIQIDKTPSYMDDVSPVSKHTVC